MRIALTLLLALHGAIHLAGFAKWSKLAAVPQLSGRTLVPLSSSGSTAFAVLWLAAFLVLAAAAALRLLRHDSWWALALGGVLLSQCLIVLAWSDARFGTIANVLILVPALAAAAHARFERRVDAELRELLADAALPGHGALVTREDLDRLPPPVRAWLDRAGVVGRPRTQLVRLAQRGELRTAPDAAWMPAEAEQHFTVDPPAFLWRVDATMLHLLPIAGRDAYRAGHGHMLIKAASLIDIVDAADAKIDHGAMLRFLGEIVWFPSAALAPYITWEPLDATSARATMRHAGDVAIAVFHFDAEGRVTGLSAERYLGGGPDAKLTPWLVSCTEWRRFQGVEVPARGDVGWALPAGPFTYYRWQIVDLELDPAAPHGAPAPSAASSPAPGPAPAPQPTAP